MIKFFIDNGWRSAEWRAGNGMLVEKRRASSWVISLAASIICLTNAAAINVSPEEAMRIGKRVWQNECGGTVSGLTSWNEGENFASLGIGHFIWYPAGQRGPFAESFPKFVAFARQNGANPPASTSGACPWNSRAEFQAAQNSAPMKELRSFLAGSVNVQAQFLVTRLDEALAKMLAAAPADQRAAIQTQFERVGNARGGAYALIDYVNFKGEGVLPTERYRGEGWGLLQVLAGMHGGGSQSALDEFARSAKTVLQRRVQNSPPERKESRWLPGWLHRVASYAR
jgi:hypothetical protein